MNAVDGSTSRMEFGVGHASVPVAVAVSAEFIK